MVRSHTACDGEGACCGDCSRRPPVKVQRIPRESSSSSSSWSWSSSPSPSSSLSLSSPIPPSPFLPLPISSSLSSSSCSPHDSRTSGSATRMNRESRARGKRESRGALDPATILPAPSSRHPRYPSPSPVSRPRTPSSFDRDHFRCGGRQFGRRRRRGGGGGGSGGGGGGGWWWCARWVGAQGR